MEPKIRFKGFDSRLDKSLIGDFCHISTGKSNTQDKKDDGIYPFYVRSPHIERSNKYLYDEEAVLTVGDGVGTGKVFHYVNGKYDLHQRVYRMFNFKDINAKYFYYLFSQKFYKRVMSMTAKSSVDSVRLEMISKMEIEYPSINEQETIANYFTSLDSQISASTSRLASLKQMKAASLQAMFPQEGETVPKIRFKGFEGEWKKVKADSIFKTFNEKNRPDLPVLSATQDRGMVTRESIGYNIFHDTSNEATYKHILPGQFVIHLRSFQGGFAHSEIEGIASPAYTIMDFKNKDLYHDYYWRYVFMSKEFIKRLELITYGIRDGRSISYDEFKEMSFLVPSKEEQIKIASYLKNLDRQISLQSQRLEKLKQIKSACLDKMFV